MVFLEIHSCILVLLIFYSWPAAALLIIVQYRWSKARVSDSLVIIFNFDYESCNYSMFTKS